MTGLAPHTAKIYSAVAALQCIQPYHLVGGTALSLQINHRLSEDLDFCKWVNSSSAANAVSFREIEAELMQVFSHVNINYLSFDHIDFRVYGVKVTFFNEVGYNVPEYEAVNIGNINCVPIHILCAMKIKTMFERTVFRDYYDV
ncbi:MAG TPA: nucleotidyl transferase AbiEii/AbiGii toxin family protein [Chryseosolibacter sp.]